MIKLFDLKKYDMVKVTDSEHVVEHYNYTWFSYLIWRNSIIDVDSELNIPKPIIKYHMLPFSEEETIIYEENLNYIVGKCSQLANM